MHTFSIEWYDGMFHQLHDSPQCEVWGYLKRLCNMLLPAATTSAHIPRGLAAKGRAVFKRLDTRAPSFRYYYLSKSRPTRFNVSWFKGAFSQSFRRAHREFPTIQMEGIKTWHALWLKHNMISSWLQQTRSLPRSGKIMPHCHHSFPHSIVRNWTARPVHTFAGFLLHIHDTAYAAKEADLSDVSLLVHLDTCYHFILYHFMYSYFVTLP